MLYGIQLKWLCVQKSWIPHGFTYFLWASSAVGITVCVWLPRKGATFLLSFTVNTPGEFLWSVTCFIVVWALHICETQLFSLPINTEAEQADVFMKWMWHLCRWLRAETESQSLVFIFAVVTVCMSKHIDEQQAAMGMVLGQPSDLWGGQPAHFVCDTATSSDTDIEEISVTPTSTSFFSLCLNFLMNKWLTHQINQIDRDELSNEIKGKTSVISIRIRCHFPFPSSGTEQLDAPCIWGAVVFVAAAKVGLVGSLGGHELVQDTSGLTGTTVLVAFPKTRERVFGESGKVLCMGSCESLSSGMEICQCSSWPQWVQCLLWVTGDTRPVTCTERDRATTDASCSVLLPFLGEYAIYWGFLMLPSKLFHLVILWFLRKCLAGLLLITAFIQSGDPSRRLIIEFKTVAFDLRTAWRIVSN